MASFKAKIIDDTVLAARVTQVISSDLPNFLKTTYSERANVQSRRWYVFMSATFLSAILVSFYLLELDFSNWSDRIVAAIAMCWAVVLLLSGRAWFMSKKLLSREMNMALSPMITNSLDAMTLYTHSEDTSSEIVQVVRTMLARPDIVVQAKDRYQIFEEPVVQVDEVRMTVSDNSFLTNTGAAEIGSGVLISAQVSGEVNGLLAASAKGSTLIDGAWEELCVGKYVVAVPDEFVARAAVTKEDMQGMVSQENVIELFTFLHKYHQNDWLVSIQDGQFRLLLLGDSIRIPLGKSTTDRTKIARQAYGVITPIWKGLRAAELFVSSDSSK